MGGLREGRPRRVGAARASGRGRPRSRAGETGPGRGASGRHSRNDVGGPYPAPTSRPAGPSSITAPPGRAVKPPPRAGPNLIGAFSPFSSGRASAPARQEFELDDVGHGNEPDV